MTKSPLILQVESLKGKLMSILERQQAMRAEITALKTENKSLKSTIKAQKTELEGFQYQEEITKIVDSTLVNSEGVEELKDRIDQYIREIDSVVNFLNKEF